jgi:hypothetical protein
VNLRALLALGLLAAAVTGAFAQGYEIPWYSVNSGGNPGSNARYLSNGTAAQAIQEAGIGISLRGYWGFWVPDEFCDAGVTSIVSPQGSVRYRSTIEPQARARNFGTIRLPADVTFRINDSLYVQTLHLAEGLPSSETLLTFPALTADTGYFFVRCSVYVASDGNRANDVQSGIYQVTVSAPRWVRRSDLPSGPRSKRVKDGGAIAYREESGSGLIYALKGNKTNEFYRYDILADRWTTAESIPSIGYRSKKKLVKKGSTLVEAGGRLYAAKGSNSFDWWSCDPAGQGGSAWQQRAPVPGTKGFKDGTASAAVSVGGVPYVYVLKGAGTCEFYRFNTLANTWEAMAPAPVGLSRKGFKNGSSLAYDPDRDSIYVLKGSYNEFYAYSVQSNTWSSSQPLPMVSPPGTKVKKAKDGAGIAYHDNTVFALKGGNTYEFWKYPCSSHRWCPAEDILPGPTLKRVRAGGSLLYAPSKGNLFATKGNNTLEFYMYWLSDSIMSLPPALPGAQLAGSVSLAPQFSVAPNPFRMQAAVTYSLNETGRASLKLYSVSGELVRVIADGTQARGVYRTAITRRGLSAGIYLVRFEGDGRTRTEKVVIQ